MLKSRLDKTDVNILESVSNIPMYTQKYTAKMLPLLSKRVPKLNPLGAFDRHKSVSTKLSFDATQTAAMFDIANLNSCAITGVAGCGKTSVLIAGIVQAVSKTPPILMQDDIVYLQEGIDPNHKYLKRGMPGILVLAATRQAIANLASKLPKTVRYMYDGVDYGDVALSKNCMTIHKALEYRPVRTDDNADGLSTSMFEPYRTPVNRLPPEIKLVVIDEATLPKMSILEELLDTLPHDCSVVVAGDLYQIQSVGGLSVLALLSTFMKVHSFTTVYRHDGEIIKLATAVRQQATEYLPPKTRETKGILNDGAVVRFTYGHDSVSAQSAMSSIADYVSKRILSGAFVPGLDLHIAFHDPVHAESKGVFGITPLYERICEKLDEAFGRPTYFVKTMSRNKHSEPAKIMAVGDVVLGDVQDNVGLFQVLRIVQNPDYVGDTYPPMCFATRSPFKWREYMRVSKQESTIQLTESLIRQEVLSMDIPLIDDDHEVIADKQGRKASHKILMLDITNLILHIQERCDTTKDADIVSDYILKAMLELSLNVEGKTLDESRSVSDSLFRSEVMEIASRVNLGSSILDYVVEVSTSESMSKLLPYIMTAHKAQGLTSRDCLLTTHGSNPGYTEQVYTSVTRPRCNLITITHPTLWGRNTTLGEKSHRSDVHSPQIAGITVEEKLDHVRGKISNREGYMGVTVKDVERLCRKILKRPLGTFK